jgi:hypothetical protein
MEHDKFAEFDKALLAQVRLGKGTMKQLDTDASGLRALAWPLCTRGLLSRPVPPPRVISDRLIVLEQKGMIHFNGSAWLIGRRPAL